eukprot:CAMPEP_0173057346 /NCGR_PEP_ID=MMETSP1102-20130122/686_1 /TAXON_ID=49646 /ORGANISM="Geminigera sp., Strain Caron Lab Isolate" /LENGTH=264 /DNA_ID=CAMNT_0013922845 /DNA_START=53 /DNA_END=847 /DNA_ORIENTATION=-
MSAEEEEACRVYVMNRALQDEIEKDTKRTWPDLHFFREAHDFGGSEGEHYDGGTGLPGHHQLAITRVLFTFARLNPGIRYVQGMNEVLAPIYYVFKVDPTEDFNIEAEADAFWCFHTLMETLRDVYDMTQDDFQEGIHAYLNQLECLLAIIDPELAHHLVKQGVKAMYYAMSWITLMLSQEFRLPDVLRLWDSILAQDQQHRLSFLLHICCAMVVRLKDELLRGDFAENLQLLQSYPREMDVEDLIYLAKRLESVTVCIEGKAA